MRVISGLKKIFQTPSYAVLLVIFLTLWFLLRMGWLFIPGDLVRNINLYLFSFSLIFMEFLILLFVISFFRPIRGLHIGYYLLSLLWSAFFYFVFRNVIFLPAFNFLFVFCVYANIIITAFFAFKFCMDSSINIDNFIYQKTRSKKLLRMLEFIGFGILVLFMYLLIRLIVFPMTLIRRAVYNILFILFWINLALLLVVIIRALLTKKFAAYISPFFLFTLFYIVYIFVKIITKDEGTTGLFLWILYFIIDFLLFIYIISTLYDRVDYIQNKLKYVRAETIALFILIMKIYFEMLEIGYPTSGLPIPSEIFLDIGLLIIFIFFTFLFGIHSIIVNKSGELLETEDSKLASVEEES